MKRSGAAIKKMKADWLRGSGDILYFLCQAFIFRYYYNSLSIEKIRGYTYTVKTQVLLRRVFLPLRQAQIKRVGELSA